jgi:hypothetical protein
MARRHEPPSSRRPPTKSAPPSAPSLRTVRDADELLRLQRLAGNAAVVSLLADPSVQRDPKPTSKKSIEIIFILVKPGDQYIKDVTNYVKTTLKGQAYRQVANVEEICAEVSKLAADGFSLSRVRIVSHGQRNLGGVGMTPAGEKKWRYVGPDEVKAYMGRPECKGLKAAMAPGAEVEFWGCYIGQVQSAGEAWANLFGKQVRSSRGEMKIGTSKFIVDRKGNYATSSKNVPKGARGNFRKFLLGEYAIVSSTGEAPNIKGEDEQVKYMTDLFDRSGGVIRSRVMERAGGGGAQHRPGTQGELDLEETVQPGP